MERKDPERDQARIQRIVKAEKSGDELVAALAQSSRYSRYDYTAYFSSPLFKVLNKVYGKELFRLTRLEQLWNRELARAVAALVGPEYAEEIHEILKLRVEGQFSTAPWRHSYHSSDIGYYAYSMIDLICELIYSSCYPQSVEELLYYNNDHGCCGYEYRLALRIRRGDSKIIGLVREAVLGDGTQLMLSRNVIEAIIVSGDEELLEDLLRLLLAARLQEGLRQQVLESADKGSTKTLARIIKFCLDEDMFRYSSAMRAFGVWTGVGFDDVKPANVKKCAQYAYDCLVDEALRKEYLNSENNQQAYFALWAMGCHEIRDTELAAQKLLDDEKPYRRVLGWLFVYQSNSSAYKMHFARLHLDERDDEILAWVLSCLPVTQQLLGSYYTATVNNAWDNSPVKNELFPDSSAGRLELFAKLKEAALYVGNRRRTFSGNPFDFVSVTLENTGLINCMMSLAGYDMHPGCIGQLLELQHLMNAEQRRALIIRFLKPETYVNHRAFLRNALSDRSIHVKELAVLRLSACELDRGDFAVLTESLRSKSSSLRKAVLSVFRSQSMEKLEPVIISMLGAKEEYQNQAAIELLLELREEQPHLMASCAGALGALKKRALSTQTTILLEQLGPKAKSEEYSLENGYGLYEPAVTAALAASVSSAAEAPKSGLVTKLLARKETQNGLLSTAGIKALFPSWEELDKVLERMNKVFECHADYEYEVNNWEGRAKILFGNPGRDFLLPSQYGLRTLGDKAARIEMLPFYDEFLKAMGQYAVKAEAYIGLRFVTNSLHNTWLDSFTETADWFKPHEKRWQGYEYERAGMAKYKLRYWQMLQFIQKAYRNFNANELYKAAMRVYSSLIAQFGESELGREFTQKKEDSRYRFYGQRREQRVIDHGTLKSMRSLIKSLELSAEDFKDWFLQEYRWEKLAGGSVVLGLEMEDYLRACGDGVAPRDAFMEFVICSGNVRRNMGILTRAARWTESRELFEKYPWLTNAARDIVERILQTEERRGELTTELTEHARAIARFEGAEHFCNLLAALGKESFFRGYEYSGENTKKAVLSSLLKHCWPAPDDTPEDLAALLKKTDISEKRLAEAVMYAPQWADFAEKILGWPGLKCGVWFFHAHISEHFSAEKETEVALYSPISPQQFNDGAFDKNWFFKAYGLLGEKRLQILYRSAKYITCGSNSHRRSQLYTDAVLGRLDIGKLEEEIGQKRNQEKLRCYPLIPIPEGDGREALRRYEFIQNFLKQGRQFGAQRRENEKKACATAMENLAITTGLMDVNRLMWQMESAKIAGIRPLMEPVEREGVILRLCINAEGDASLAMEKNGKPIKTAPKPLVKDEYFLSLKAVVKELKEQKRRARESLERAMMDSARFGAEELVNICSNPVLMPSVGRIVWTDEAASGFLSLREGEPVLTMLSGEEKSLGHGGLRIAHPHDLMASGEWAGYMRLMYEKKLVQPFKQVFREYYPITADERQEGFVSRRYAGHQLQPKKTVALLKSRGWTVDYEEGLQKVYYKEELVARMYALADWFSPADIEAPTLEVIRFYERESGEPVELQKVPPIVFSETMRDIDLVVSVAHVGGVDSEASHSTVEMRTAIAVELLRLLGLENVSMLGSHAKIRGRLANYSVHMGSGVVHAEGRGMIAIIPVHSQARGRIFLPFADDDPKTAEIMSKIIMLAEDNKIKDPSILSQICG